MEKYPIIEQVQYSSQGLTELEQKLQINDTKDEQIIFRFPTVYIILSKNGSKYNAYVGETNDIKRRTAEHINEDAKYRDDFSNLKKIIHTCW